MGAIGVHLCAVLGAGDGSGGVGCVVVWVHGDDGRVAAGIDGLGGHRGEGGLVGVAVAGDGLHLDGLGIRQGVRGIVPLCGVVVGISCHRPLAGVGVAVWGAKG